MNMQNIIYPNEFVENHDHFTFSDFWNYQIKVSHVFYLAGCLVVLQIIWKILTTIYKSITNYFMKRKGFQYRQQRDEQLKNFAIPATNLDQETIQTVLNADVTTLKKLLKSKVTSEDLVNIFAKRCQQFGGEYNIITHLKYEEAIREAKECDKLRRDKASQCQGLLFGIPISVKEIFDEKGYPSTVGCIQRLKHIPLEDGFIITLLRKSGAIPFLRTNIPQLLFTFESCNNIYGRVQNPWNRAKYAGGSSGGEAAAIVARLSPLGLGTDSGGSIRVPASFCGVYGFRQTQERNVITGHTKISDSEDGSTINRACSGPIGKSVDDLILMFKALSDPQILKDFGAGQKDPNLVQLPIDEQALKDDRKKRRFGYFKSTAVIDACQTAERAVDIAIEKLKEAGHELVEVEIPSLAEIVHVFLASGLCSGLSGCYDLLNGESFLDDTALVEVSCAIPNWAKKYLISPLLNCLGQKRLSRHIISSQILDSSDYKKICYRIIELRKQTIKVFDDNKIEAIICPSVASPAFDHGITGDIGDVIVFSFIWNLLNYPCGVLPITKIEENEQHYDNAKIKDQITDKISEQMKKNTVGLPVGVQVVAPPYKDEVCLNVMKIIDSAVQFYKHNPYPLLDGEQQDAKKV